MSVSVRVQCMPKAELGTCLKIATLDLGRFFVKSSGSGPGPISASCCIKAASLGAGAGAVHGSLSRQARRRRRLQHEEGNDSSPRSDCEEENSVRSADLRSEDASRVAQQEASSNSGEVDVGISGKQNSPEDGPLPSRTGAKYSDSTGSFSDSLQSQPRHVLKPKPRKSMKRLWFGERVTGTPALKENRVSSEVATMGSPKGSTRSRSEWRPSRTDVYSDKKGDLRDGSFSFVGEKPADSVGVGNFTSANGSAQLKTSEAAESSSCFAEESCAGQASQPGNESLENIEDVQNFEGGLVNHPGDRILSNIGKTDSDEVDRVAATCFLVEEMPSVADKAVKKGQQMVMQHQVAEIPPGSVGEHPDPIAVQVSQATELMHPDPLQVAAQMVEHVTETAAQVTEKVTSKVVDFLSFEDASDTDSDDEFESFTTSDLPEFRGMRGLQNFVVVQDNQGPLTLLYDFYIFMMKKPLPEFATGLFAAPILVSLVFTLLYLPEFEGLAFDDTARQFFELKGGAEVGGDEISLQLSWSAFFQVFMFSLSLSTGLEPELAPLSPYTLVVANINALVSQIVFVFLSGSVFARLSQPSQPVRCSSVALVSPPVHRRRKQEARYKVLTARYVLAGPQPSELVDVKVDLTYKYNSVTRTGSYLRATQSLKLMYHGTAQVRPEVAYLTHGMLVRHVIDETSPLYGRSPETLDKEDAVFTLGVMGIERSSMQSIFHVQHYCVVDGHVIWDAEFEDMLLISKKKKRIVDHSKLNCWKHVDHT